ncbi:hypothetical protein [Lysinibacillus sp. fls2-241-R2A-57]|uniref:hypothetical protein n=1 Tax=Lysinibacillus sp. fls2-241-R2A-57 TaxID=3040292 RepID=UPI0025567DF1|nr:hypothetical protein [Lysinibacillus sp. fls2-241-R2A-57]
MFFLRESVAQRHCLSVRKRSVSGNKAEERALRSPVGSLALCESEATATNCFICAKAKRQQQSE